MKRKLGKERWREKGDGLLLTVKEFVSIVYLPKCSRFSVPFQRWSALGIPCVFLGFSLCLLASPPAVPVVTVPFSGVYVDCEVVFSDSDCEFVELQTFSPPRTRSKCGFGF